MLSNDWLIYVTSLFNPKLEIFYSTPHNSIIFNAEKPPKWIPDALIWIKRRVKGGEIVLKRNITTHPYKNITTSVYKEEAEALIGFEHTTYQTISRANSLSSARFLPNKTHTKQISVFGYVFSGVFLKMWMAFCSAQLQRTSTRSGIIHSKYWQLPHLPYTTPFKRVWYSIILSLLIK